MRKLSEDEVWKRALKSVDTQNAGRLRGKPTLSHPSERARLIKAVVILRQKAARPFGPEIIEILESYGWPSDVAEYAADIAHDPEKYGQEIDLREYPDWPQEVVDSWFEGDE